MQFTPYAKGLLVALSLSVMAGCSSSGGAQDGDMDSANSGANTAGMNSGANTNGNQMSNASMPDVRTIYFAFDKDTIRPEFESVLMGHAQYLKANTSANVVLEGHADERGTREYNLALGERRAKQVATYLMVQGVSAAQIDTVSYGEEKPLAIGKTEAEYSQNRRVEIVYK